MPCEPRHPQTGRCARCEPPLLVNLLFFCRITLDTGPEWRAVILYQKIVRVSSALTQVSPSFAHMCPTLARRGTGDTQHKDTHQTDVMWTSSFQRLRTPDLRTFIKRFILAQHRLPPGEWSWRIFGSQKVSFPRSLRVVQIKKNLGNPNSSSSGVVPLKNKLWIFSHWISADLDIPKSAHTEFVDLIFFMFAHHTPQKKCVFLIAFSSSKPCTWPIKNGSDRNEAF